MAKIKQLVVEEVTRDPKRKPEAIWRDLQEKYPHTHFSWSYTQRLIRATQSPPS